MEHVITKNHDLYIHYYLLIYSTYNFCFLKKVTLAQNYMLRSTKWILLLYEEKVGMYYKLLCVHEEVKKVGHINNVCIFFSLFCSTKCFLLVTSKALEVCSHYQMLLDMIVEHTFVRPQTELTILSGPKLTWESFVSKLFSITY